ncbi:helix-turn-helix domain-containing protein [Amycolatopsis sp. K13G38]|uniref:Helix-turn-helix domain-containing protein n=1 Tax=Amycolatopsis acididurans TaxID=2724524 RepID=A0ABX1JAZ3_9PSEU|nr:helix-turn-helix transcriptional regulator [Amycolatopsis acididurans]NKQ56955.1 helix-turn-helix domain-containing protein [Amycolatopsis acididurans]
MTVAVAPKPRDTKLVAQRRELARFLRTARERVKPAELGLAVGARRRAPGLLREEVAQLASISCSWYSWLEQGRPIQVSESVLASVAAALRLSAAERDHMFRLAGHAPPGSGADGGSSDEQCLRRMLHQLRDAPAYLIDRRWNILDWNEAAGMLFGLPLEEVPPEERNALRFALLGNHAPLRFADPVAAAHFNVAHFRADTAALVGDPAFERQVEQLQCDSALFRLMWPLHEVRRRPVGVLHYRHRSMGPLRFDFVATQTGDDAALRLHTFLPCQ